MWARRARPRGRALQPPVVALSPAGSGQDVPPGGGGTVLCPWLAPSPGACSDAGASGRHGRPGLISVFPRVCPRQRGHLRGPSARVAGGDTGTLLHVTLGSFTLLEKQVLAAALKSQQRKNKWGAAGLEIYWRCHQIMRFKRDLWKRCSFFPPWCGGCSGSVRATPVQHDVAAGPWVLAGSAHGGGHLLIQRYFHLHLNRRQPEQRGRGAEAAGLRAGRAGGRGVAAVRCEPGTRSRNNVVMDLTLGCSYPPPTR